MFEPLVEAPVELDQGSDGIPTLSFAAMPPCSSHPGPKTFLLEPPSERVRVDLEVVVLCEHLAKERGPVIGIGLLVQAQNLLLNAIRVSPIGGLATQAMDKPSIALAPIPGQDPVHLTLAQAQGTGSPLNCRPPVCKMAD